MIVIKIGEYSVEPFTVDTTLYTVDSTEITVDTTFRTLLGSHSIKLIPRKFTSNVTLSLWDELNEVKYDLPCTNIVKDGIMEVIFEHDFNEGDRMGATLFDGEGSLLWRGKIYATTQDDLQEFKMNVPNNNNIITM